MTNEKEKLVPSSKKYCFIHYSIYRDGVRSDQIFRELIDRIKKSGLEFEEIFVVTNGNADNLKTRFSDFSVSHVHHENEILSYEFPTIEFMHRFSLDSKEDHSLLYLHLKGVTSGDPDNAKEKMCRAVIDKNVECVELLKDCDACGASLVIYGYRGAAHPHFSGNFWWSKVSHIRDLPVPAPDLLYKSHFSLIDGRINKNRSSPRDQKNAVRYLAELWIGMKSEGKYKEVAM